jgi:hypothetical protein
MQDQFMAPIVNEMIAGEYLGSHEYWWMDGPGQNWLWWAGRFMQSKFTVPRLITECGMDQGVVQGGMLGGWKNLPGTIEEKAARYVGDLAWYANRLKIDGRVKAIFPFTFDMGSNHWEYMNVRDATWINDAVKQLPSFISNSTVPPVVITPPVVVAPPTTTTYPIMPRLIVPVKGTITQQFGEKKVDYSAYGMIGHNGQDIASPLGTPIVAPNDGECWAYNDRAGYGLTVEIWYPSIAKGVYKTICAHMSKYIVRDGQGQMVKAGEKIGEVGSTGNSTGNHVHFGVKLLKGANPGYAGWSDPRPFMG